MHNWSVCTLCVFKYSSVDIAIYVILILCRYNIITQCWAGETENRPLFSEVVTLLSEYLEGIAGYTMLDSLDSEHEYLDI